MPSHTRAVVSGEPPEPAETDSGGPPAPPEEGGASSERRGVPREIDDVSFPVSIRGYDRGAVDAYVSRVQHLVGELELTRSPEAAVKRALEQVGEQTKGILEQAGLTAEEITTAARQDADETLAHARNEAAEIVGKASAEAEDALSRSQADADATLAQAQTQAAEKLERCRAEVTALREEAEARVRKLRADTDAIQQERSRLLADIREITMRIEEVASAADARFPPAQAAEPTTDITVSLAADPDTEDEGQGTDQNARK